MIPGVIETVSLLAGGLFGAITRFIELRAETRKLELQYIANDTAEARAMKGEKLQWTKRLLAMAVILPPFLMPVFSGVFDIPLVLSYSEFRPGGLFSPDVDAIVWKSFGSIIGGGFVIAPFHITACAIVLGYYFGSGGTRSRR